MRQFALSDAARVKLNSELARHKSRQRFAASTAFVVAPKAQCTQSSRSQTLWSFEANGVIRSVKRLHTIMPVEIIFMFGKIEAHTTGTFLTYFYL